MSLSSARRPMTMYAFKLLRCHGLSSDALQVVYKAVVLANLLYASPAWWSFATVTDTQRIEAFLRQGVSLRLNLYSAAVIPRYHNVLLMLTTLSSELCWRMIITCSATYYRTVPLTPTVSDLLSNY